MPEINGLRICLTVMNSQHDIDFIAVLGKSPDECIVVYEDNVLSLATGLHPRFQLQLCRDANHWEVGRAELLQNVAKFASTDAFVGSPAEMCTIRVSG